MNAPPHLRDRKHFISRLQKRRNGKSPCEEKHIGLEQFKLPGKPVSAANNLFGLRISVARRAAFKHIQNHTVASAYQSERIKHGGQELAGFADKRNALKILLCPRCLSHHNEFRSGSAVGEDNMLTAHRRKRTSSTVLRKCLQRLPIGRSNFVQKFRTHADRRLCICLGYSRRSCGSLCRPSRLRSLRETSRFCCSEFSPCRHSRSFR